MNHVQTNIFGPSKGDSIDSRNALEVELLKGLASLLFVAGVDHGSRAGRNSSLFTSVGVLIS